MWQRACRRERIWFWQRRPLAATCGHLRPLAATCSGGHLRPLDWLQVAASGCRWEENAGGHLAATRLAASGCKWLPLRRECWPTLAAATSGPSGCRWEENDGGHWRLLEWLQVAARRRWNYIFPHSSVAWQKYWEFSVACARKIENILRGRSLGNLKYCTVLISMLRYVEGVSFEWGTANMKRSRSCGFSKVCIFEYVMTLIRKKSWIMEWRQFRTLESGLAHIYPLPQPIIIVHH